MSTKSQVENVYQNWSVSHFFCKWKRRLKRDSYSGFSKHPRFSLRIYLPSYSLRKHCLNAFATATIPGSPQSEKRLKQRVRTAGRLWWTSGLMVAMAMGMGGSQAASIAVANSWDNFEMERVIWGSYFLWDASIAWPCCLWAVLKGNTYGRVNWPLLGNQDAKGKDRKGLRFQYPLPCHTSKNMTCFV